MKQNYRSCGPPFFRDPFITYQVEKKTIVTYQVVTYQVENYILSRKINKIGNVK